MIKISHNCIRIALLILYTLQLHSQNQENVFRLKAIGGINACQIHGDNYSGYHKFGINFGLGINSKINDKASFEVDFLFTQKGARRNQRPDKGDYHYYRVNLNYVEIPLNFMYYVNKTYFITLGGYAAYLINYSEATELGSWNGKYPFNNLDLGINVGLGRKLKENLLIEVRSVNSVIPIRDYGQIANLVFYPNPVARFFNKGLYNNVMSIFFIYQMKPLKKRASKEE